MQHQPGEEDGADDQPADDARHWSPPDARNVRDGVAEGVCRCEFGDQIAHDDRQFSNVDLVPTPLKIVSHNSPKPVTDDRAKEISSVLFSKYPEIDKEAMNKITREVERMSEKLSQGLQP